MFRSLLIANRGEIACRVIGTARRLGIATIAIYSEADANSRHVRIADRALPIGPAPAAESYLAIDKITAAARTSGAEAIHPGYGFLAENADFAEACAGAGIVFVGPPPGAIRAMGDKAAAKRRMEAAGIPLIPGYHGADQEPARLAREAARIGFPVLIKPSAGGGGKGMRTVAAAADFADAMEAARREARAAFGDATLLVEKHLSRARHVEVQVFADTHGNCIHLLTRDCSAQRRHQKVIEEAPAPGLSPGLARAMGEAAVAAAREVGYVGAGTVEFLVEGDAFYFMEMNTRLQVEHPVTEAITGLDLVEWQLRVAAGERLPLRQNEVRAEGHAVEARIYAEDAERGFLPAAGRLLRLAWPAVPLNLRIDSGVEEGDRVSSHYDPLLAKLIVWDRDRAVAVRCLAEALDTCEMAGVANNLAFLARVLRHPQFAAGPVDTGFVARHIGELAPEAALADDATLALAVLAAIFERAPAIDAPASPWSIPDGWQANGGAHANIRLRDGARSVPIAIHFARDGYRLGLPGGESFVRGRRVDSAHIEAEIDGSSLTAMAVREADAIWLHSPRGAFRLRLDDPLASEAMQGDGPGRLTAPMPGVVIAAPAVEGARVERGAPLVILEAMKMEHVIRAPSPGKVTRVCFRAGDRVREGDRLVLFEAEA